MFGYKSFVSNKNLFEAEDLHPDYKLVKTGKKSTIAHKDGKPTYDLHYKGEKISSIEPYSSYKDKKAPGSRIVSSRKDVTKYSANHTKEFHDKLPKNVKYNSQIFNDTTARHVADTVIRHHQGTLEK